MGQKTHPIGFRIGITENWRSRWYARKAEYGNCVVEDFRIRQYVKRNYYFAGLTKIEIERRGQELEVILHSVRPGIIIGRKGAELDRLRAELMEVAVGRTVAVTIREIKTPELEAQIVAESIAEQLEKRLHHWFEATERYPRQLREINRTAYLTMKRSEHRRQQAAE